MFLFRIPLLRAAEYVDLICSLGAEVAEVDAVEETLVVVAAALMAVLQS